MNIEPAFDALDQALLASRGLGREEAARQAALLAHPPRKVSLKRPCTVGDGVRRLSPEETLAYAERGRILSARARVARLVPASGAASRMFKDLLAALESPVSVRPPAVERLQAEAARFAFAEDWAEAFGGDPADPGRWREALAALLQSPGLDYARRPKAYLAFHASPQGARTAFEEQVRATAELGIPRVHFTLSPEHEDGFRWFASELPGALAAEGLPKVTLAYSFQDPSTDTLAGDGKGGLFRDDAGRLVLRPGGHGALIRNLGALAESSDVALLRNIDNVAHARLRERLRIHQWALLGLLEEAVERHGDGAPVRVAAVVPNTGEPGGGPYWIAGSDQPQIVESAQVDLEDPAQAALFRAATHFNPVDIACRLTDSKGKPFDLERFVDPEAVFISDKSHLGRPLRALERPGLWNGAMARWRTELVELPLETFTPVKTVFDLLRPEHQPSAAA
jgi:hypothetical protein